LLDKIEAGASVTVTNRTGPHVTNRKEVYFYRHRKTTHYYFIDERELKNKLKKLHQRRLKRGVLDLIGAHKKVKLYRLNRQKVDEELAAKKRKAATKAAEKKRKPDTKRQPTAREATAREAAAPPVAAGSSRRRLVIPTAHPSARALPE
jgi:hypothetical protein